MKAPAGLRDAACLAGLAFYRTGLPCRRGHVADRYTCNFVCVVCDADYKAKEHTKRARRLGAPGRFKGWQVIDLLEYQGARCARCNADVRSSYAIDHVIPLSKGGTNWPSNLQILCVPCNGSKGAKLEGRP